MPETSPFSFAQITALSIVFQVLIVLGMYNFGLGHNLLYCRWHPAVQKVFHMQIASRILDWLETDHQLLEYYKFLGEQVHHPRMSSCKKREISVRRWTYVGQIGFYFIYVWKKKENRP